MTRKGSYTKKEKDWLGREKEVHYDSSGKKIGKTTFTTDLLGRPRQEHFDRSGKKIGETRRGSDWLGRPRAEHFDPSGTRVGHSKDEKDWLDRKVQRHYDKSGKRVGETRRGRDLLGRSRKLHQGEAFRTGQANPPAASRTGGRTPAGESSSDSPSPSPVGRTAGCSAPAVATVLLLSCFYVALHGLGFLGFDRVDTTGEWGRTNGSLFSRPRLTTRGMGPIRVGMTLEHVVGIDDHHQPATRQSGCEMASLPNTPEGVEVMIVNGAVARIDVTTPKVATLRGARVGDPALQIARLYRGEIEIHPHAYEKDGQYMTFKPSEPSSKGYAIVFETDGRRVTSIRAGRKPEVDYIERCF